MRTCQALLKLNCHLPVIKTLECKDHLTNKSKHLVYLPSIQEEMNEGAKKCVAQKHHVGAISEHSKGAKFLVRFRK